MLTNAQRGLQYACYNKVRQVKWLCHKRSWIQQVSDDKCTNRPACVMYRGLAGLDSVSIGQVFMTGVCVLTCALLVSEYSTMCSSLVE